LRAANHFDGVVRGRLVTEPERSHPATVP
jgi:hypothetical protein